MEPFKWIWEYIKKYKWKMVLGLTLVLMVSMLNMVIPRLSGVVVDDVIRKGKINILMPIVITMLLVTLVKSILRYIYRITFEKVSQNVVFNIRETIYNKLQKLDFNFFDTTRTGDIMTRMTGDMEAVRHFIAGVIFMVFQNATLFIFAIIMMFSINVKLTLILLTITPITGYFAYRLAQEVKPTFLAIRKQLSKLNSVVQENISGNRVVKAFTREDYEIKKFSKENEGFRQRNLESANVWEKYLPVLESLAGVMIVVMLIFGGVMVMKNELTWGEFVVFSNLIWALNNPMRMLGWLINDIQRFAASAQKITTLIDTKTKIKNSKKTVAKDKIKGKFEFRNVSFKYDNEYVLKNINFKAEKGQTIAIIGPTGSGKSTFVNLICRFYDVTQGQILIDDIDIRNMDIRKFRNDIAIAMQDVFLFSDTIEGNIAYGVPNASMQQVKHVAKIADADDFILDFNEGYDTIVGERGVGLSGGQKQRIALARALLKNPSILILDDTTSSLDMETEYSIQKKLKSYCDGKTTIIIAHRISSVKDADMILVLDNGEIVERGKHEELLNKRGYYYDVFVNQLGDFDISLNKEVV